MSTNNIHFRPFNFSETDYEEAVAIHNAVWPGNEMTPGEMKFHDESRDKNKYFHKIIGELNGRVAGMGIYCEAWWYDKPGRYFLEFETHPEFQCCGLGSAYYDFAMNILRQRNPLESIEAMTREDKPESIRFLQKRGFKKMMRYQRSQLDVQAFDPIPFTPKIDAVKAKGIEIFTVAELKERDADWLKRMWQMDAEIIKDLPAPDPIQPMPFEQYEKRVNSPGFFPEAYAVAVDNGRYVGTSALWRSNANQEKLYTGLTGVLRSHRRLGLATAMKVKTIGYAKALGYKSIETDNEENNPMYQINVQLGFEAQPAELEFHKIINEET